jgi:hypothetical protein
LLFIGFWWYSPQDVEAYLEKFKQMAADREKGTAKSPKLVFGPYHFAGQRKGFAVYEVDDVGKLVELENFFWPELTFKFVPLVDNQKVVELTKFAPRSPTPI